jgi:hypothetical protein
LGELALKRVVQGVEEEVEELVGVLVGGAGAEELIVGADALDEA